MYGTKIEIIAKILYLCTLILSLKPRLGIYREDKLCMCCKHAVKI